MKKQNYVAPEVVVVKICIEKGVASSNAKTPTYHQGHLDAYDVDQKL